MSKILTVTTLALAVLFSVAANPSPLPMGVEMTKRDGMTFVREVLIAMVILLNEQELEGAHRI
ncbi:hypothetical protein HC256_000380 [Beauveria bassiana]|nr:hypothetical protein HC256_000380 [Beauveria bassiana]